MIPLVSSGLSLDDAINSLKLTDAQKETLISFAMCYNANIVKSGERIEELQQNYQAVANDSNIFDDDKEKILRLLDEYYSTSP